MPPPTMEEMQEALGHPLLYPEEFKHYISDYVATHLPEIPITQVYGFHVERFRMDKVDAAQSTLSTSYTNLTTVGPTLDKLPDGVYLVIIGALVTHVTVQEEIYMSFSVNGAGAVDDNAYVTNREGTGFKLSLVDLRGPPIVHGHTIQAKYKNPAGARAHTWERRFMIALKVVTDAQ